MEPSTSSTAVTPSLPETTLLPARPDAALDRYARLLSSLLGVPAAVVSLVARDGQVFPGAVGLPPPWQATRRTPLSHSFCQHVVTSEAPMLVDDAREDAVLGTCGAIEDLGVVAYAGAPVREASGAVVGALAALAPGPRAWTPHDRALLEDLAAGCSSELQLRQAVDDASRARASAEEARADGALLLELSEALASARTVQEVARTVTRLARTGFGATFGGLTLADHHARTVRSLTMPALADQAGGDGQDGQDGEVEPAEPAWSTFPLAADAPPMTAVTRRPSWFEDLDAFVAAHPHLRQAVVGAGPTTIAHLPMVVGREVLGSLALGWDRPRPLLETQRQVVTALAGYAAQAVQRCMLLEADRSVARTLQEAMLTRLPQLDHLQLAARYLPAATDHQVGGDWYDAVVTPDGVTTVVIGDVTGHDTGAAASMGQLRSVLRGYLVSVPETPAQDLARLDRAIAQLQLDTSATVLVGRLEQDAALAGSGWRRLRWSTAGHPPPAVVAPDGAVRLLPEAADPLLGFLPESPRCDHTTDLAPGSTLLLYTDGLVERRDQDLARGLDLLVDVLTDLGGLPLEELLDRLLERMVRGGAEDDVALLAVRLHPQDVPRPPEAGPADA